MIDWEAVRETVFLRGSREIAYRDPAGHYHDGVFRVFHTQVHREEDGRCFLYVAVTESTDLVSWSDEGILTLGQETWTWARGRLTAGHVLDLRDEPCVGRWVMFFHGTGEEATRERETHGEASLGIAWSADLVDWAWPGK